MVKIEEYKSKQFNNSYTLIEAIEKEIEDEKLGKNVKREWYNIKTNKRVFIGDTNFSKRINIKL